MARGVRPDAVLSNVLLPDMDGFELCQLFRTDPNFTQVPVVLMSSSEVTQEELYLALGMGASALVARTPGLHAAIAALVASIDHGAQDPTVSSRAVYAHHLETALRRVNQQSSIISRLVHRCSIQASMLSVLASLPESLRQAGDEERALRRAIDSVLDVGGLSRAALYLGCDRELELAASRGFDESDPLLRRTLEAETRMPIEALDAAFEHHGVAPAFAVVVPVLFGGERLGALLISSDARPLAEDDLTAFARAVAAHIGSFLHSRKEERGR
jgi:CheY-like chemotaxis protein